MRGAISYSITNLMQFVWLHWGGIGQDRHSDPRHRRFALDAGLLRQLLPLPARPKRALPAPGLLGRWKPAWRIKTNARPTASTDCTRGGGFGR
jgi:hypothetical protein